MAGMKKTSAGLLAGALLALHLLVVGTAMSPVLHHLLHHDAAASDHQCAATTVIDGQIDRPDVALAFFSRPAPSTETRISIPPEEIGRNLPDTLPGGRAPPVA
jgi:hypothetical protein